MENKIKIPTKNNTLGPQFFLTQVSMEEQSPIKGSTFRINPRDLSLEEKKSITDKILSERLHTATMRNYTNQRAKIVLTKTL